MIANAAAESDNNLFRRGAKLWLMFIPGMGIPGGTGKFYGMAPHGQMIEGWIAFKHLKNFRVAWVPTQLRGEPIFWAFPSKDKALRLARAIVESGGGRSMAPAVERLLASAAEMSEIKPCEADD